MNINKDAFWKECLQYIKERIPEAAYDTWFNDIKITLLDKEEINLQVPNQFHYEWVESKYRNLIDAAINKIYNHPLIVNYSIVISDKDSTKIPSFTSENKPIPNNYNNHRQLNNRYTFENFIEGKNNQFAKSAAYSVAESPAKTPYNPLMIYSNPGLGKTHLLQAIGNYVIQSQSKLKVCYITSEKFMLDFINSIQKNNTTEFAKNYRKMDILLIDDIQFFQSKEQTQEQFFHLFNELYQNKKQIVLTSDKHPSKLIGIQERLVSRFQSGLSVDIQPPNLETRIAILLKKAKDDNIEIPYDITEFLASNINTDIRTLEGAMVKLLALSSLKNQDINLELAKDVLSNLIGNVEIKRIDQEQILNLVSKKLSLSKHKILGKSRKKEHVFARHMIMYLTRDLTDISLENIGLFLGKRDHATVIHANKVLEKKMNKDKFINNMVVKFKKELLEKL